MASKKETFEEKLEKINTNIKKIQESDTSLEEAIKIYEDSIKKIKEAEKILDEADGKVRKIIETSNGVYESEFND